MPAAVSAVIAGAYEVAYRRHCDAVSTADVLAQALLGVVESAGVDLNVVDGLGVASFTLHPDHAIDLAWRLGMRLRWVMQDPHGGASGLNMLQHALRAVENGDARCIILVAGDHFGPTDFSALTDHYNRATEDHLTPLGLGGPNALFAMLTDRHMRETGLKPPDYAQIPLSQRRWAALNPNAVYRAPLTLAEYEDAPVVFHPLRRFDCVPVVTGADAVVVTSGARAKDRPHVRVLALQAFHNPDDQRGDGLHTGHAVIGDTLWDRAGIGPNDIDLAMVYDDYPVMVLAQLADLACIPGGDLHRFLHHQLAVDRWPLNTSGGQLSAGQAGAGAGMHFLVEAVTQLQGRAGDRQVAAARHALVTGYGMVLYRYGACANAAVLEANS